MILQLLWTVLLWLALLPLAQAASFDCAKAKSEVERLICQDPELSKLDEELAKAYAQALAVAEDPERLQQEQREWVREQRQAENIKFLKRIYQQRIERLNLSSGSLAPREVGWFFEGDFDDGERFQMNLFLNDESSTRTGDSSKEVNGEYWYLNGYTNHRFKLNGRLLSKGAFFIAETEITRPNYGGFEGEIKKAVWEGTFSPEFAIASGARREGSREKKFSLRHITTYDEHRQGVEDAVRVIMPRLLPPVIQKLIGKDLQGCDFDECRNVVEIKSHFNGLVGLLIRVYGFNVGSPHGQEWYLTYNILQSASVDDGYTVISSENLLKADVGCENKIARVLRDIAGVEKKFFVSGKFIIRKKGLIFYYDPYVLGSYPEGGYQVFMPFSSLSGCILESEYMSRYVDFLK